MKIDHDEEIKKLTKELEDARVKVAFFNVTITAIIMFVLLYGSYILGHTIGMDTSEQINAKQIEKAYWQGKVDAAKEIRDKLINKKHEPDEIVL